MVDLYLVWVMCRLDSLIGLFGVGCQPISSNDPFGLRRMSYGLVSHRNLLACYLRSLVSMTIKTFFLILCISFGIGPSVSGK